MSRNVGPQAAAAVARPEVGLESRLRAGEEVAGELCLGWFSCVRVLR